MSSSRTGFRRRVACGNISRSIFDVCVIIISSRGEDRRRWRRCDHANNDSTVLVAAARIWKLQAAFVVRAAIERKRKDGAEGMGRDSGTWGTSSEGEQGFSVRWHTRTAGRFRKSIFLRANLRGEREKFSAEQTAGSSLPQRRSKDDDDDSVKFDDCATNSMETSQEDIKYINWRVLLSCWRHARPRSRARNAREGFLLRRKNILNPKATRGKILWHHQQYFPSTRNLFVIERS